MIARQALPADFPFQTASHAEAGDVQKRRRPGDSRPAIRPAGTKPARTGTDLHSWRAGAADDARLPLHVLLPQRLRDESIPGEPGICRALGKLPDGNHVWPRLPGSRRTRVGGERRNIKMWWPGRNILQSLPTVDPKKIGLWGGSYGGFLTAMGLARNSDHFRSRSRFARGARLVGVPAHWENRPGAPDAKEAEKLAFDSSPDAAVVNLEISRPADSRRRRPQCSIRADSGSGATAAGAACRIRRD